MYKETVDREGMHPCVHCTTYCVQCLGLAYLHGPLYRETVDREGRTRVAGEEWMVRRNGAYLCGVYEEIVQTVR